MSLPEIKDRLAGAIARAPSEPVADVIVEEIWVAVVDGSLEAGERLPTLRQLAIHLGVSPRTVERAYEELERLGVVHTRTGEGTFVSLEPPSEQARERRREFRSLCRETVSRAEALGFSLHELMDALAEFRTAERDLDPRERIP